eukprot:c1521_g1_i1.p1 GENE.c1521_g1_i1~~c1521_g1_i1.p1  ORF type:complete len:574 (+),score=87.97 c1521_g1_i1:35-1756(+)
MVAAARVLRAAAVATLAVLAVVLSLAPRGLALVNTPVSSVFSPSFFNDSRTGNSQFGYGFAFAPPNTLAVGEGGQSSSGMVHIYAGNADGSWTRQQVIQSPQTNSSKYIDRFGLALALSDNGRVLVVGAPRNGSRMIPGSATNSLRGMVYVYTRAGSSGAFAFAQILLHPTPAAYDKFGSQVEISADGTLIFVRSVFIVCLNYNQCLGAVPGNRGVHVFKSPPALTTWTYEASVKTFEPFALPQLGQPFAINAAGSEMWILSIDSAYTYGYMATNTTRSQVLVYSRNPTTFVWTQTAAIRAPSQQVAQQLFGLKIVLGASGEAMVAAPRNDSVVYRYGSSAGALLQTIKIGNDALYRVSDAVDCNNKPLPWRTDSNFLGTGMAISPSGLLLAIGAPFGVDANEGNGAVYLYRRFTLSEPWTLAETFMSPYVAAYQVEPIDTYVYRLQLDEFGFAVVLTNDMLVVSAKGVRGFYTYTGLAQYLVPPPPSPPPPPPAPVDAIPPPPKKAKSIVLPLVLGLIGILIFLILLVIAVKFAVQRFMRKRMLDKAKKDGTAGKGNAPAEAPPAEVALADS